jgi:hypothetical protein
VKQTYLAISDTPYKRQFHHTREATASQSSILNSLVMKILT